LILLLPANDGKRDNNLFAGPREFGLQAEMRTNVVSDISLDLTTANGKIRQHAFSRPLSPENETR